MGRYHLYVVTRMIIWIFIITWLGLGTFWGFAWIIIFVDLLTGIFVIWIAIGIFIWVVM
jgi:hypothetical protein